MTKRRVLVIGPDQERSLGGMATVIRNTVNSQVLADEFEVSSYPSFMDGNVLARSIYATKRELLFPILGRGYDIYHIHICSGTSTWRKMRYVKQLGNQSKRTILHVHGARYHLFFQQCSRRQRRWIKRLYASVARVIVLSEEWRDWFLENELCDYDKINVLYNAVNMPEENLTDYTRSTVLFMGRLGERKSPDTLLSAAAEVLPAHPDARLVFGGDGDVEKYRSMANELGIASSCEFLGWVSGSKKEAAYLSSSIYCLPSKNEGMPMGVLEAMSHGLATIATPVGGIPRVIDNDVNGLLFPAGDSHALAQHLDRLLSSSKERVRIGTAGRQKIAARFDMETYACKLAQIYKEVSA